MRFEIDIRQLEERAFTAIREQKFNEAKRVLTILEHVDDDNSIDIDSLISGLGEEGAGNYLADLVRWNRISVLEDIVHHIPANVRQIMLDQIGDIDSYTTYAQLIIDVTKGTSYEIRRNYT